MGSNIHFLGSGYGVGVIPMRAFLPIAFVAPENIRVTERCAKPGEVASQTEIHRTKGERVFRF
jgi:hypothetical protein